jgi:translation elongation factor EF-Ts
VLLRQAYIRDDRLTVDQLLSQAIAAVRENIVIRRIVRWEAGEENGRGVPTNPELGI